MIDLAPHIEGFLDLVSSGGIEIYNEASVQFELAIVLRAALGTTANVQLERNVSFFGLGTPALEKTEMDIVIFTDDEKHCIEIKYPENGQRPEQMYAACEAIRFLEQLVTKESSQLATF